MRHWVDDPASAVKVYDGAAFWVVPVGPPVMVGAAGGVRSSVKVSLTSVDSFAESSLPRTLNVYTPSGCAVRSYVCGLDAERVVADDGRAALDPAPVPRHVEARR